MSLGLILRHSFQIWSYIILTRRVSTGKRPDSKMNVKKPKMKRQKKIDRKKGQLRQAILASLTINYIFEYKRYYMIFYFILDFSDSTLCLLTLIYDFITIGKMSKDFLGLVWKAET